MITLGGYGGYVTVGFDHTIKNKEGKMDFRIVANAFYAELNGVPDEDEWYEIAESSHVDHTQEAFYQMGIDAGNDMNFYKDYEMTYYKPDENKEPVEVPGVYGVDDEYIKWKDNKGNSGFKVRNNYHAQPYYPQWEEDESITFIGTRLPQNGIDESGQGNYFVLYTFGYGYADNRNNGADLACIDISWAVDSNGNKVNLPGVELHKGILWRRSRKRMLR